MDPVKDGVLKIVSRLLLRRNSFFMTVFKVFRTSELTVRISLNDTGPFEPVRVPKANCIFSPSTLIIWDRPSSSRAIEARIKLITSFLSIDIVGVILGIFGNYMDLHLSTGLWLCCLTSTKAHFTILKMKKQPIN